MKSPLWGEKSSGGRVRGPREQPPRTSMAQENSQTETGEVLLAPFDLLEGTSESARAKTAETLLELLGARVRHPNTRSAYRVAWRSFLGFCSARQLELESVKAYQEVPGRRCTRPLGKFPCLEILQYEHGRQMGDLAGGLRVMPAGASGQAGFGIRETGLASGGSRVCRT